MDKFNKVNHQILVVQHIWWWARRCTPLPTLQHIKSIKCRVGKGALRRAHQVPVSHKRVVIFLICGILFMFGVCYMMVPLYQLICKKEGRISLASKDEATVIDYSRTIKVDFITNLNENLKFTFIPLQSHITIHPGERKLIYFHAENLTGKEITVQAIPSITPTEAARFLKKTECFCFTQQYFFKGQKADMPVYFFIEPEIAKDIKEVVLAYTLFDTHLHHSGSS